MKSEKKRSSLIELFVKHPVGSNLLIAIMLMLGVLGLVRLNTQLLPTFNTNVVTVTVAWPGANPVDIERSITVPIENQLDGLDQLYRMSSISSEGLSLIIVEFNQKANLATATQRLRDQVNLVTNLPQQAEQPVIAAADLYYPIARVVVSTTDHLDALRHWVRAMRKELLDRGISKVEINGMPEKEIAIHLTSEQLLHLNKSLSQLSVDINQQSRDVAGGMVGVESSGRQIRGVSQQHNASDFSQLPIVSGDVAQLSHLLDVATIAERNQDYSPVIHYKNKTAIDMSLLRDDTSNSLAMAKILKQWVADIKPTLPEGISVHVYYQLWHYVRDRINLLLRNGLGGLFLIYGLLFLFLIPRVALWTAAAVPLSLMTAMFFLYLFGGSINMISLFAFIMTLGIIVDDTIVVAEESYAQFQQGVCPKKASILGALRMRTPILCSSLTTLAAFSPLLLLGGLYGAVLQTIPLVVICVIVASLVECFLILPYHLKRSFVAYDTRKQSAFRLKLDNLFIHVRDVIFKNTLLSALKHRFILLLIVLVTIFWVVGLLASGRVAFSFFPTPEGPYIFADITFLSGVSEAKIDQTLHSVERAAEAAGQQLSPDKTLVKTAVRYRYQGTDPNEIRNNKRLGSIIVELDAPENREISNNQFIAAWKKNFKSVPWVENIRIMPPRNGPPGADIDIGLYGASIHQLKSAAIALTHAIGQYAGVINVNDNLPYAQDEVLFTLRPEAHSLGLTVKDIGEQIHNAFTGKLTQIFYHGDDKIDVRVRLDEASRSKLSTIRNLPIITPHKTIVPLSSLVTFKMNKSYDSIQHLDRRLTVNVTAEVDALSANTNKILADLKQSYLPSIMQKYGVQYVMKGRSMGESETLTELSHLIYVMFALIYIILAWVSGSYLWPVLVMSAIPLGLEGAIFGHWLLGKDLTLLSLFGFFGLTGIVINDSIILLFRYKELCEEGMEHVQAIITASVQRFRPVMLTSLTTIAGVSPLLFEKSQQAQFLIPMAISICFGLAFSTALILIVIPCLISFFKPFKKYVEASDVA